MIRLTASALDAYSFLLTQDWMSEEEFASRMGREKQTWSWDAQAGIAFHHAAEKMVSGVPNEGVVEGRWTDEHGRPQSMAIDAISLFTVISQSLDTRLLPTAEAKTTLKFGDIEVVAIADLLYPGYRVTDWKTKLKGSFDPANWMASWQGHVYCHAFGVEECEFVGVKLKAPKKGESLWFVEREESYSIRPPKPLEEIEEHARSLVRYCNRAGIAIADNPYRYGRPD